MTDITQPPSVAVVNRRDEGRAQNQARDPGAPPAKKVTETYQEVDRTKPVDDRITILGIPAEQITPATHAALASLVGEINFLRSAVKRLERAQGLTGNEAAVDPGERFVAELAAVLALPPAEGEARVLVLAYLNTFEDVRRSSGLLAAKTLLADVIARFAEAKIMPKPTDPAGPASVPVVFSLVAPIGGAAIAGLLVAPAAAADDTSIAQYIRDHITQTGYAVSGIDMNVSATVAAIVVSAGEGALTALGRVDHLMRG
ncbi:MAG: hypothetical protein SFV21_18885 [Rhodospirillaceae bacterium]|nr:hypothetical protein [Rhodospirillaceae bacterium]